MRLANSICGAAATALMLALPAAAQDAPAAAAPAAPAAAPTPGDRVFKLMNTASTSISAVYVAPAGTMDLSDDLLGKQVAGAGKTVTLKAKDPRAVCVFDLEFLMNNGDTVQKKAVNLCETTNYAFAP